MWTSKTVFIISALLIILVVCSTNLAVSQPQFSVSPDEFTVSKAPPLGESWRIQQKLVVWNRDNVARLVFVTSEVPPENGISENDITAGYRPIPNENWVQPFFITPTNNYVSSIQIPQNSYAEVVISFEIPRWENLTNQKWEVWIPVERQPLPGEVGVLRPTVRIKIETTEELPPLPVISPLFYIAVAIVAGAVVGALGLWVWLKRRPRKRRSK